MIGNTHIDPVWLWDRAEGMQEVKASFMSALDRMEEFPEFRFTQSSISYLEWMKENCPEIFSQIQKRVEEGRWEIVGGMWVEPDCNLPSGEALVRHFLYGKKFVKENFGKDVLTGYNVDSFGHSSNLPAICRGCGIRYYLTSRPDKKHLELPPVFLWKSADGSGVLTERTGGEYMAWTRPALEENLRESLEAMEKYDYDKMAVFYGVGNHGGGPTVENIRTICEMRDEYEDIEMDFSVMDKFFGEVSEAEVPVFSGELGRIFYGCYSADKKLKECNRKGEWGLLKAEAAAAMAANMGRESYRNPAGEIELAWKEVLFNQFHDVLAGTSVQNARKEAVQELQGAAAAGRKIVREALQAIANEMDTRGEGLPLILFNFTGTPFKGIYEADFYLPRAQKKALRLRDFKGREIPYCESTYRNHSPESRKAILFQADVPAYGYAAYRILQESPDLVPREESICAREGLLDNNILSVRFDETTGCPCSRVLKGEEMLDGTSRVAVYYDDRGAWGETVYEEEERGQFEAVSCRVVESSPMRAVLRYLLKYENSELMADYILEAGSECLRADLKLRNAEKHRQITLNIPVKAQDPEVVTETGFLAEKKVDCRGQNQEYCHHRFVDIAEESGRGIAVFNDSVYGMRQAGSEYRAILLRSYVYARGSGGPLLETLEEEYTGQGMYEYSFLLRPHTEAVKKSSLFAEADLLHMPLEHLADNCHKGKNYKRRGSLLRHREENVQFSAVKCPYGEKDGFLVRAFETEGENGSLWVEKDGVSAEAEFTPHQIKTMYFDGNVWTECNMLEEQET